MVELEELVNKTYSTQVYELKKGRGFHRQGIPSVIAASSNYHPAH